MRAPYPHRCVLLLMLSLRGNGSGDCKDNGGTSFHDTVSMKGEKLADYAIND